MFLPLLLLGVVAFWAGTQAQQSKARSPVIGALGTTTPAHRAIKRLGEQVQFQLGVPYQIIARTRQLSAAEQQKLHSLLTFGTYHARNIAFGTSRPGTTTLQLCFVAPKTSVVPIGQPLDWDLGDGSVRLALQQVRRLDGRSC